jgi:hypothetical protein
MDVKSEDREGENVDGSAKKKRKWDIIELD